MDILPSRTAGQINWPSSRRLVNRHSDRYSGREDDPQVPRQLRQSRHRRPLPAHLPREIHRLEPEESCCPECGGELDYLGEVSTEQLELVSSALKVIRTERVKKACTKCDCIVEAPAPSRPIERHLPSERYRSGSVSAPYPERTAGMAFQPS